MANTKVWEHLKYGPCGLLTDLLGTWIPLDLGVNLAHKYNVYPVLQPIFDFIPGEQSPPPAPKHTTAATNKAKPRAAPVRRLVRK